MYFMIWSVDIGITFYSPISCEILEKQIKGINIFVKFYLYLYDFLEGYYFILQKSSECPIKEK